jgi:hypothetical protein
MNTLAPLTAAQVKQLVDDWYLKLDVHAPVEELLPMLAPDNLELRLPEVTLHSLDEFKKWYEGIIHIFFDEVHTMQKLVINTTADRADVRLVVRWEASRWNVPAPKSQRLAFDAVQTWVVCRSADRQQPIIETYTVDSLTPLEGFPNL